MGRPTESLLPELAELGRLARPVAQRIETLESARFVKRLWDQDAALWSESPEGQAEARQRLGWMTSPEKARTRLPIYVKFADEIRVAGITRFLVLGMGGSSLAAEAIGSIFEAEARARARHLGVLDSTNPDQVAQAARDFPPDASLYIVSSKSGGTAEVMSAFNYFWSLSGGNGARFIAISDEGTSLQVLARGRGFLRVFTADAHVGGRYSALTDFGMVPAALLGIDLHRFLDWADNMMSQCAHDRHAQSNPGVILGALLGEAALQGVDKLTLLADSGITTLSNWIEQLVAESSGKDGKGIVPVSVEPLGLPEEYGSDRLFVYLRQRGQLDAGVGALRRAGFPVFMVSLPDQYCVAAEFVRWEVAIATACHILGVNAFDQPDVQESKDRTKSKIEVLRTGGSLDGGSWDVDLSGPGDVDAAGKRIKDFLAHGQPGDYVAINAYLPRRPDVEAELQELRVLIRERTHLATTVGFGPRFQHSTGQLHKGGPNEGLFIQVTSEPDADLAIPDDALSFGGLIRAQALGDYETLIARGRRVIRVHLGGANDVRLIGRSLNDPVA